MDWRVKAFEPQALSAFSALTDLGFGHSTDTPADMERRPRSIIVRFSRSDALVETRLALAVAGEDTIGTTVHTVHGVQQLGPSAARKGHEMRKALREHASEAHRIVGTG